MNHDDVNAVEDYRAIDTDSFEIDSLEFLEHPPSGHERDPPVRSVWQAIARRIDDCHGPYTFLLAATVFPFLAALGVLKTGTGWWSVTIAGVLVAIGVAIAVWAAIRWFSEDDMPRFKKNTNTARIHLEVHQDVRDRMERLRDETGADTLAEVFRNALAVYDALLKEIGEGGDVFVRHPGQRPTRLLIPGVAPRTRRSQPQPAKLRANK